MWPAPAFHLVELAPGVSFAEVAAKTAATVEGALGRVLTPRPVRDPTVGYCWLV